MLHQRLDGAGQAGVPIVFSHALGLDLGQWDGVVETFSSRHPILRYDQRGHGRSAPSASAFTMDDLVDDAVALIEGWGRGPVVFVGLSMGGMVGQGLALRRPDLLRGLVLAHTVARYAPPARAAWAQRIDTVRTQGMAAVADMVVERYLNANFRAAQPGVAHALRQQILAMDPVAYAQACAAVAGVDWLDRLPQIVTPTLVLAGAQDVGATPEMARDISARVPGASLEVFPAASHLSVFEDPASFERALTDFLATLPTTSSSR
jgi:3-oxoadipate enol-lactonase